MYVVIMGGKVDELSMMVYVSGKLDIREKPFGSVLAVDCIFRLYRLPFPPPPTHKYGRPSPPKGCQILKRVSINKLGLKC